MPVEAPPFQFEYCGGVPVPPADAVVQECFENATAIFTEASGDARKKGLGTIKWSFRSGNVLNENLRVYPTDKLKPEVDRLNALASKGRLFGEIDHPTFFQEQAVPNLDRASHRVTSCTMEGDQVTVEAIVLDNPKGAQLASCYKSGGDVAVSHRAMVKWGEPTTEDRQKYGLSKDTSAVVAKDLRLITYDAVSDPGFKDAFTRAVQIQESRKATDSRNEVMPLTREEMNKAENVSVRDILIAEGRAAALADPSIHKEAIDKAKAGIVEEATKPFKDQVATLTAESAAKTKTLEGIRSSLTEAGVISKESITGTEAATKITALTTENAVAKTELTKAQADLVAAQKRLTELEAKSGVEKAIESLKVKFKDNPHLAMILEAAKAAPDEKTANTVGEAKAAEIAAISLKLTGGVTPANTQESGGGGGGGSDKKEPATPAQEKKAIADGLSAYGA